MKKQRKYRKHDQSKKKKRWFFKTHSNKIDTPLANPNENKRESRHTILEIKRGFNF